MRDADPVPATTAGHPVWQRIRHYQIGPPEAALSFTARLARENGWSATMAARVIDEYRRFAFLAVTGDTQITPSDAVDQAWHLHLTYTRDYWERFCPEVLGTPLHHGPTAGGAEEQHRFFRQYADTLARYEAAFGAPPPSDIWPAAARRLLDDPRARRVHPRDAIILSRPQAALVLLMFAGLIALALFLGVS
ncbi:glycine-rich domain-containing protein [Sphingomonas sp. LT1P40]|uniref:glycine-rich domain-containing protein n=1 Tax=Alteristakelama amylovorans TaxID=3096166 RepID=UPI002FCA5363